MSEKVYLVTENLGEQFLGSVDEVLSGREDDNGFVLLTQSINSIIQDLVSEILNDPIDDCLALIIEIRNE